MHDEPDVALTELLREVRHIQVHSNRLVTSVMAGGYTSVFRGAGIEFDDVREYAEGDDPRMVDWNVSARMGRPYVKKYVDERELTILFLLDLSASMSGGFGAWSARQTAVRICACLALAAVRNNDKVGLIAFSDGVDRYVPAKKGTGHVLRIVRDTLALRGKSPRGSMGPALDLAGRVVRRRSVLFVISDFLDETWRRPVATCARRHDVVAVRLFTPELVAPRGGLMRVRDPESGRDAVVDWSSRRVRETYEARVGAWRAKTASDLRRLNVDLMDVQIPREPDRHAVARPILEFFRMRELRGEKR